jgi:hypothetical protein
LSRNFHKLKHQIRYLDGCEKEKILAVMMGCDDTELNDYLEEEKFKGDETGLT